MAVPKFEEIHLPVLTLMEDGQEHKSSELEPRIADHFELSEEDRAARLPSGTQRTLLNRVPMVHV